MTTGLTTVNTGDAVLAQHHNAVVARLRAMEAEIAALKTARGGLERVVVTAVQAAGSPVDVGGVQAYRAEDVTYTVALLGRQAAAAVPFADRWTPLVTAGDQLVFPAAVGSRGFVIRFPDGEDEGEARVVRMFILVGESRAVRSCG